MVRDMAEQEGMGGAAVTTRFREILDRQRRFLFPSVKPAYAEPVVMESGDGVWVRDAEGEEYLDLFSGILSTSVGHCNPRVVEAVTHQASKLGHTSLTQSSAVAISDRSEARC